MQIRKKIFQKKLLVLLLTQTRMLTTIKLQLITRFSIKSIFAKTHSCLYLIASLKVLNFIHLHSNTEV